MSNNSVLFIDRSYMTSYQPAIKTVPSCTIFELFDIEKYCDLKI